MMKRQVVRRNPGDHLPSECNHTIHGKYIHHHPETATEGKEMITIRQMQEKRDLLVPSVNHLEVPGIMALSEFQRLKKQATVITPEERRALQEKAEETKNQLINESRKRKEEMMRVQLEQNAGKGSILEEAESEAAKKSQYLLQRAFELRQEQEDEIKGINGIILESKCLAIREAQIEEKKLIQKELEEEDRRLDRMMEQRRQQGLEEEKQKKKKEEERNHNFVQEIKQHLRENEIRKLVDAERKEEEARTLNKLLVAMQQEEKAKLNQKQLKQKELQDELNRSNADMEHYKAVKKEEEKFAEARLKEFLKQKEAREQIMEEQQKEARLAKEQEIGRLRKKQQKAADLQAQRDEMNAYRLQEEAERKWRQQEKEAALKKKQMVEALKRDREKQIEDIKEAHAREIARDEEEFHKVARLQYEEYLREQEKLKERREKATKHKVEILKQVNEKERERIELRKAKMEEGQALRMEKELREMQIKDTIEKKIEGLRQYNVPDQNIQDIKRQVHSKIAHLKFK